METIGRRNLWSFTDDDELGAPKVSNKKIRESKGRLVNRYLDLAKLIAELQYRNPDYVLLFRGQSTDHRDGNGLTSFLPRIFRRTPSQDKFALQANFINLNAAGDILTEKFDRINAETARMLRRYRTIRWSIVQHYEIADTPLVDFTQSLRVAASFATNGETDNAFVYVIGVPQISGAITASAETGVELIRLASVCPPEAVRPHVQEAYLLGEYPEMDSITQKSSYPTHEIDCAQRLLAKFRFQPSEFWSVDRSFPQVPKSALYPSSLDDPLAKLADEIKLLLQERWPM